MGRAEVLQGVRAMRFEGLLDRHERGELSQEEAAERLGVSERTFRRWRDRLRDEGRVGLRDRRIGKPSSRGPSAHGLDPWGRRWRRDRACWGSTRSATARSRRSIFTSSAAAAGRQARLHGDPAGAAKGRPGRPGQASRHPPQEARAPAAPRHAAVLEPAPAQAGDGRALAQLGIAHIPSYTPEARPHGTGIRHPAEAVAAGAAARRDRHGRGRRPLSQASVRARRQRPLRRARHGRGSAFLCAQGNRQVGRDNLRQLASVCRSRRSGTAITTSRPPCGYTNIPTGNPPFSMVVSRRVVQERWSSPAPVGF